MSIRVTAGNTAKFFNINNKQVEFFDAKEFLMEFIVYPDIKKLDSWEINPIAFIGTMGSGKSNSINSLCNLISKVYGKEVNAVRTNDIGYCLDKLNENVAKRKFVQIIVIDDAIETGFDSRRSMSSENVYSTQTIALIRHKLALEDENYVCQDKRVKKGICFLIFALQSDTRLDVTIRRLLLITFYKTYFPNLNFDSEYIEFLKDLTEDSAVLHRKEAKGLALGKTISDRFGKFYFPYSEFEFNANFIKPESDYSIVQENLIKTFDLMNTQKSILKGYLYEYCKHYKIDIPASDFTRIIETATFKQFDSRAGASEKVTKHNLDMENIHELRKAKISFYRMEKIFHVNQGTIFSAYKVWCKKHNIIPILSTKNMIYNIEESMNFKNKKK